MVRNYFKIAFRSLLKNKGYSAINILGLATGLGVAIMIGLWIEDELSFNKPFKNYGRIAQVMQHSLANGTYVTSNALPVPLATELKTAYAGDFKYVVLSSWTEGHTLSFGDKNLWKTGNYIEPQAPDMLSLKILKGSGDGLKDTYSVMLSESAAKGLFGEGNPLDKIIKIDNQISVKVTAVYEDLPFNTGFSNLEYLAPWTLNVAIRDWVKNSESNWENNSFQIYTQLADEVPAGERDMEKISSKIRNIKIGKVSGETARAKPAVSCIP